jgi:hypothetical protein
MSPHAKHPDDGNHVRVLARKDEETKHNRLKVKLFHHIQTVLTEPDLGETVRELILPLLMPQIVEQVRLEIDQRVASLQAHYADTRQALARSHAQIESTYNVEQLSDRSYFPTMFDFLVLVEQALREVGPADIGGRGMELTDVLVYDEIQLRWTPPADWKGKDDKPSFRTIRRAKDRYGFGRNWLEECIERIRSGTLFALADERTSSWRGHTGHSLAAAALALPMALHGCQNLLSHVAPHTVPHLHHLFMFL